MIILGIDPGLTNTGYGLVSNIKGNSELIDYGIIAPIKSDSTPQRLYTIFSDIEQLIGEYNPTIVSIEEVFYSKNFKSALMLGHARGAAIVAAAKYKIPVFEYSARKVKQSITGNGNADKTQVQYMIKQIFNLKLLPEPLDASDALGIALCHINQIKLNELW